LVIVFAIEVLAGFAYLFSSREHPKEAAEALKDLATIFLSPTVALVGAATGFYFGRNPN
jgi:hypothetical protein